jgi:ribonuclease HII
MHRCGIDPRQGHPRPDDGGNARQFPHYDFDRHKGYVTPEHAEALHAHGPCAEHRASYINVRRAAALQQLGAMLDNGTAGPSLTREPSLTRSEQEIA